MSSHVKVKWSRHDTLRLPLYIAATIVVGVLFMVLIALAVAEDIPFVYKLAAGLGLFIVSMVGWALYAMRHDGQFIGFWG